MSNVIKQLKDEYRNIEGMDQFFAILEIPDLLFDNMYKDLKSEIEMAFNDISFEKELVSGITFTKAQEAINAIEGLFEILKDENMEESISDNKKDFIFLFFNKIKGIFSNYVKNNGLAISIPIEVCNPKAKIPTYAHLGDSGMDVYSAEYTVVNPYETTIVKTGLKVAIPIGYEIQVRPRSGLSAKTGLRIPNSPGTIDSGYRDEVGVIVQNTSSLPYEIKSGDRIAQFVLQKVPHAEFCVVDSVAEIGADRKGGFGSTGK